MIATQETQKRGSYLNFMLGEELFAAAVGNVREIIEPGQVTKVPKAPRFLLGVINLRGSVLPVIDTRLKFGLAPALPNRKNRIVVFEALADGEILMVGALVDAVTDVLEINMAEILPPPEVGNAKAAAFVSGIIRHKDKFVLVTDVNKILSKEEAAEIFQNDSELPTDKLN